ncbi:SIMPL domain-containing protein [Streptomyces sp. COG19]|uniref:SIMPL domain-containing protein n=1 Tax=Streptomyces sp. COG19 TaxID=2838870 RepID=UPI0035B3ABFC
MAHITITLTARGTDRRTTLDDLTTRNTTTLDLIKSYGDTIEKLETGTLTINPELTHGRAERIRAYHGRLQLTATVNDFTTLGEIVTRLADHDLTRVDGPWWTLRPTSPHHAAARRQAVREALQRAPRYAEPSTPRLGALLDSATPAPTTAPRPRLLRRIHALRRPAGPQPPTPPPSTSNPYARPSTPRSKPPSPSSRPPSDKRSSERVCTIQHLSITLHPKVVEVS